MVRVKEEDMKFWCGFLGWQIYHGEITVVVVNRFVMRITTDKSGMEHFHLKPEVFFQIDNHIFETKMLSCPLMSTGIKHNLES